MFHRKIVTSTSLSLTLFLLVVSECVWIWYVHVKMPGFCHFNPLWIKQPECSTYSTSFGESLNTVVIKNRLDILTGSLFYWSDPACRNSLFDISLSRTHQSYKPFANDHKCSCQFKPQIEENPTRKHRCSKYKCKNDDGFMLLSKRSVWWRGSWAVWCRNLQNTCSAWHILHRNWWNLAMRHG